MPACSTIWASAAKRSPNRPGTRYQAQAKFGGARTYLQPPHSNLTGPVSKPAPDGQLFVSLARVSRNAASVAPAGRNSNPIGPP